ncbi:MAG: hypothetical protein AD742_00920 [Methylibium sp. NZG]|nr:MAG: hypothetical protein AD742_00920 [Methylibium sp. NZG]
MRVNARLDEESSEQLEYLTTATGMGVSQVLRESVALYYRQARASATGAHHLLALAGKGQSGRSDIASDVKRHLAEALATKHGLPPAAPGGTSAIARTGLRATSRATLKRAGPRP